MVSYGELSLISIKVLFRLYLIYLFFAFAPNILLDIEPNSYNLTLPEGFDGPLRANNRLSEADHLFVNEFIGPESMAVWKGDIFTGVADGRIIRIRKDRYKTVAQFGDPKKCVNPWEMEKCGRPLGMRFDSKGTLFVADAYYGLHTVNVTSGKVTRILTLKKLIGDRKPKFLDDLVINEEEGAIYFTDSSEKWDVKNVFYTVGEHDETGRVIRYDMKTKNSSVIMKSLGFPNGIELNDEKNAILVCEFNNRRIMKHHIEGEKRGQTDIFAYNLPGEPDNIRRSSDPYRETYWVALMMGRNEKNPSFVLDHLSGWPKTRKALLRALYSLGAVFEYSGKLIGFRALTEFGFNIKTGSIMYHTISHYGLALELDAEGKIIQSLHSPDGRTTFLSEVREVIVGDRKVLYLGSYGNNYIGQMTLGHLAHLNRPLLTHEKKQYIEHKKQKKPKSSKPKKWEPYEPFDLQNPHFGPQKQKKSQDFNYDYNFPEPNPSKKTKTRGGSKKKTKKSKTSKTKTTKSKKSSSKSKNKTKTDSKSKNKPKDKSDLKIKPEPKLEPKKDLKPDSKSEPKPESKQMPELKPKIDSKLDSELNSGSKTESETELKVEPNPEPKSEFKGETKGLDSELKPDSKPESDLKLGQDSDFKLKEKSDL